MGTSASYKGPNWPASSDAVNSAASGGAASGATVGPAVAAFARDFGARMGPSSGGGGSGGSAGSGAGAAPGGRSSGGGGGGGGGSRGRAARSGARLATFLGTAQQRGLQEALKQFDLAEYHGRPLEEICDALVEALTEPDGLLDDTALREAMDRTLEELCQDAQTADDLEAILTAQDMNIPEVVATYYCHALAVNFEVKEFARIRERMSDGQQARAFLEQARDYIRGFVEYRLSKEVDLTKYDLNSADAVKRAGNLNQEVIEALGRYE